MDLLLLDELGELPSGRIAVLDDAHGALAAALADRTSSSVVAHSDSLVNERRLTHLGVEIAADLTSALVGAQLVVLRLPKSLDALDEMARTAAQIGANDVRLVAGGRTKHMTPSMNAVLATSFEEVRASLGRQKSRVLHAAGPKAVKQPWPQQRHHDDLGLTVHAHGAVFAGTRLDAGTALLISQLHHLTDTEGTVVDLGCGTGILAALLARRFANVTAVDVSAAAVASARLTTSGSVDVRRADGLSEFADASIAAVVSNPPFHVGTTKDSTPTLKMIKDAGRVLISGGELLMVFNAHLPYLPRLKALGRTNILVRDNHYVVTRTIRD
ncbi:class I SAM-dependent methyltransferase [Ornithinimicrobium faecis]|uniref:class I SAM-dependent methyltransferase n=1 Tax=Ornithinimicrobium faecis TaxID=2934158 RepID=UPI002117E69B|nr:methyltransferase [Ornithinimicrobium sp. HY1745]